MPPTVTFITPMFNAAATVEKTIASIRRQTVTDWRCVVVNDGSTDGCDAIVERLARQDDRIEMVSQSNRGLPEARNRGLKRAAAIGSEFLMLLDSDDLIVPRALEWLLPAAREAGASYGGYEFIDWRGRPIGREFPMSATEVGLDEQVEWLRTMLQVSLFSREAIGETRFDSESRLVEDWLWCSRLAIKGVRWRGVERIIAGYRLRPDGISRDFSRMNEFSQMVIRTVFAEARASAWGSKIDLSSGRREHIAGMSGLGFATMQALVDPEKGCERGVEIYEKAVHGARLTPGQIAQAASNGVTFGLCMAPELDGVREREWLNRLRAWWGVCARRGWIGKDDAEAGFGELSRMITHPDAIAGEMLDRSLGGATGIGVIGLDRNGRRLVRRAVERGLGVVAFDDWSDAREVAHLEQLPGVEVVRSGKECAGRVSGLTRGWVTGLRGAEADRAIGRAGEAMGVGALEAERWDDHRERAGGRNLAMIQDALRAGAAVAR